MTRSTEPADLSSLSLEHLPLRLLEGPPCHLGEGPTYDPASDTAWWFDILGQRLFEAELASSAVKTHELPMMASALAVLDGGQQLLVAEDGLYLRDRRNGALSRYRALPAAEVPFRSNDARVHLSGTLWFSTMGRRAEAGQAVVWALFGGRIQRLFDGLTIPNAICFSPDGATGYFADTREKKLMRVALDPGTGLPLAVPETLLRHEGPGGLDGAVTDADGTIWCAHWGGACVVAYSPSGEALRRIAVPARQPSCPVFVGPDFRQLLVTSAFEGMDEAARAGDPHHGRTFLIDLGVAGKAEPRARLEVR
jgi:sugar lactone lactonase YvrE